MGRHRGRENKMECFLYDVECVRMVSVRAREVGLAQVSCMIVHVYVVPLMAMGVRSMALVHIDYDCL